MSDASNAAYAPPTVSGDCGLLLFRREDTLMAQPFDPDHVRTNGNIFPVAEQVGATGNLGSGAFSVASTGALVFRGAGDTSRELVWIDRMGKRLAAVTKPFRDDFTTGFEVALSPDEKRVVFAAVDRSQEDLWLLNLAQRGTSRFTFGPGTSARPIWSPDASRLVFQRQKTDSTYELYQKLASGAMSSRSCTWTESPM